MRSAAEMMNALEGKKVLVVGLGRTGEALARFLLKKGALVAVTDSGRPENLADRAKALEDLGAEMELGGHTEATFTGADMIVLSPGVPPDIPPMLRAREAGVPVTGEIELAAWYVNAPIAAVTGTNGKTTTTSLLGEILKAAGQKVFVGGNIGRPLIGLVESGEEVDSAVIELSSFQLETAETLKPRVAALLNVTPDHLDRYPDYEAYRAAKYKVFARQDAGDAAVLNADDSDAAAAPTSARKLFFSRLGKVEDGAYLDGDRIVVNLAGRAAASLSVARLKLVGAHNQENVMAAVLCAAAMGVDPQTALETAADFAGLPHRVELVGEFGGVRYYDDSKGTNVGAVMKSLEGFDAPVILIAGGRDKESDFTLLAPLVGERVKLLILLGEARHKIEAALGHITETVLVGDMAEAVALAGKRALPGEVVLLSPACASFDMFKSYAHRGEVFAELVGKAGR